MTGSGVEWPSISPPDRCSTEHCRPRLSPAVRFIKIILSILPPEWKARIYNAFARDGCAFSTRVHAMRTIFRLPFGLTLKIVRGGNTVEADALHFVGRLHGVHTPRLIDSVVSDNTSYLLTTWIDGQTMGEVWDHLSASDQTAIASDLGDQLRAMRVQTVTVSRGAQLICNASSGPVSDPRIPWVAEENARTFSCPQAFAAEVWTGLDWACNRPTLQPRLRPLIERDVPVVFTHGDLLPKNLVFPGGLGHWRAGLSRICLLDWEYAGWMPVYWDAPKMTWLEYDEERDGEWLRMARAVFPECEAELEADWEWRTRSTVLIL